MKIKYMGHILAEYGQLLLVLLMAGSVVGCGSRQNSLEDGRLTEKEAEARRFEMEPVIVAATKKADGSFDTRVFEARELFETGQKAFNRKDYSACDVAYGTLIERFPESRYYHSSLYNQGLCAEGLKAHERAIKLFAAHIQFAQSLDDKRDGQVRMGFNLIEAGHHQQALKLYDGLLAAPDLGLLDRGECLLRKAVALHRLKKRGEAEMFLEESMKIVRQGTDGLIQGNDIFAEAHFRRGEIYQDLCGEVQLKLPLETMKNSLAEKVRFFRQSQRSYLDSLNVRESYWATAAGMKLGELYERFYDDIVAAQFPDDLDEATRKVYFSDLRKELQPLL